MEEIIKKAIEGGYKKERYYFDENGNWDWEPAEVMFMKSLFWKALGKACGWIDKDGNSIAKYINNDPKHTKREMWLYYSLKFHEINLTQGFNKAIKYLQEIIKS